MTLHRDRAVPRRRSLSLIAIAMTLAACQPAPQSTSSTNVANGSASKSSSEPVKELASDSARESASELKWARAALARNPNLEVVATDADAQMFTVRERHSGQIHAVSLNELAAAPLATLVAPATAARDDHSAAPAPEATAPRATSPLASSAHAPVQTTGTTPDAASDYRIERSGGQVRVSGPGVSIVSAGANTASTSAVAPRTSDPIICEGARMMQLDNRRIHVEGDALIVRGGCEVHVTNSQISASGTAIVVKDGTVHVSNSQIEGAMHSFEADDRAKVFVRSSEFRGTPRRGELAQIQDQGGNRWR